MPGFAASGWDGDDQFLGPHVDAGSIGVDESAQPARGGCGFCLVGFAVLSLALAHQYVFNGAHDGAAAEQHESVS